jgi:hypothetical protein
MPLSRPAAADAHRKPGATFQKRIDFPDIEFRFLTFDSRMPIAGNLASSCLLALPGKTSEF